MTWFQLYFATDLSCTYFSKIAVGRDESAVLISVVYQDHYIVYVTVYYHRPVLKAQLSRTPTSQIYPTCVGRSSEIVRWWITIGCEKEDTKSSAAASILDYYDMG